MLNDNPKISKSVLPDIFRKSNRGNRYGILVDGNRLTNSIPGDATAEIHRSTIQDPKYLYQIEGFSLKMSKTQVI